MTSIKATSSQFTIRNTAKLVALFCMLFDYKITKKCSLNSPLIKIVYESIIVTIIIQVVTTSGTIVLNKNIPYFSCDIYPVLAKLK